MSRRNLFDKYPKTLAELKYRYYTLCRLVFCSRCGAPIEYWRTGNNFQLAYNPMPHDDSPAVLHSTTCAKGGKRA